MVRLPMRNKNRIYSQIVCVHGRKIVKCCCQSRDHPCAWVDLVIHFVWSGKKRMTAQISTSKLCCTSRPYYSLCLLCMQRGAERELAQSMIGELELLESNVDPNTF